METNTLPAIDAHAHVFVRGLPLAPQRRYAPDYDAPLEQYLEHLDRHGLSHGLLVQPSFLGEDNAYLVAMLARAPARLRGIAVVGKDVGPEALQGLGEAGIVGVRLNLIGEALPDIDTPEWTPLVEALLERAWSVEIQRTSADVAILAHQLVDAGLEVVLDHFALPVDEDDPGFARVLALGASRRTWVKLSAPYRGGPYGKQRAVRAYPRLRDAFGFDRLMWGSDWPHTGFERSETFAGNRRFLDALAPSAVERDQILAAPRDLFRLTSD
ncbi:MAG: amidohydrolase family protein [Burkholderiaceae bacterium]